MEIRYDYSPFCQKKKGRSGVFSGKPKSALLILQVKIFSNMLLISY